MSGSGNVKSGKYPLGEMSGREMSSRGTVLESCIKRHIASLKLFQLSKVLRQLKSGNLNRVCSVLKYQSVFRNQSSIMLLAKIVNCFEPFFFQKLHII